MPPRKKHRAPAPPVGVQPIAGTSRGKSFLGEKKLGPDVMVKELPAPVTEEPSPAVSGSELGDDPPSSLYYASDMARHGPSGIFYVCVGKNDVRGEFTC